MNALNDAGWAFYEPPASQEGILQHLLDEVSVGSSGKIPGIDGKIPGIEVVWGLDRSGHTGSDTQPLCPPVGWQPLADFMDRIMDNSGHDVRYDRCRCSVEDRILGRMAHRL